VPFAVINKKNQRAFVNDFSQMTLVITRWFESYETLLFEYILMHPQRREN